MLSAVGNVVHQIQEVTGIGKDGSDKQQDKDVQQEVDQAPAGVDEDESSPELTTTKKETQPSGKSVVKETQDDVPVPQDDTTSPGKDSSSQPEAATTDDAQTTPQPAETQSKPQEASPAAADSAYVPSDKPMNQLPNMGGGSTPQPKTPKKWKTQPGSWFPDSSGVQCPPGFFPNKRRYPSWV